MKRRLIRVMTGLFACVTLAGMMSCLDTDEPAVDPTPVAFVSLYHASPDAPDLRVIVDNQQISSYPLDYSEYTGYLRFRTGDRNLKFGPYGADNVVVDTTLSLTEGNLYSVFVVDEYDEARVLVLTDNSDAPATGKAKVRFLNLSPDSEEVSLNAVGQEGALFSGQAFKEPSSFIEVDAKDYDFQITTTDGEDNVISIPDTSLKPGWFYTIVVRGYETPPNGNTNVASAEIIVN
jgi:hypothetical protein